ncbi:MAG: rhomboid family intramembrane serine protease [Fibrobacter sp.]|nr:rhomboid family intramembrane serine protease [Fibrobacter sp.]
MRPFQFLPKVLRTLLIVNAVIFLLAYVGGKILGLHLNLPGLGYGNLAEYIAYFGAFWPFAPEQAWRFVTYMFVHVDFWHFLFNMLMLWMFGSDIADMMGSKHFTGMYFFCGIFAAVFSLAMYWLGMTNAPIIGASGALMGIFVAYYKFFPDRMLLMFFFFPMRIKYAMWFMVAVDVFMAHSSDGVAHFAHLGGVVGGAHPLQGQGLHGAVLVLKGQQIFHTQVVVGVVEHFSRLGIELRHGGLAGGGKGAAVLHQLTGEGGDLFVLSGVGSQPQQGKIAAFAAKGDGVAAKGIQQGYPTGGKALGRGAGPGKGQLHHQVGARKESHFGTQLLGADRRRTPLQKVAPHCHGDVAIALPAQLGKLVGMAVVEGIVFGNYTGNFHGSTSFADCLNLSYHREGILGKEKVHQKKTFVFCRKTEYD